MSRNSGSDTREPVPGKEGRRRPGPSGKARRPDPMTWSRATCSTCKVELVYGPGKRTSSSGGEVPCPYLTLPFAELRAGHDPIYFGPSRETEATQPDIRRAYNQLGRHLAAIGDTLAGKELPSARSDLAKAREAYLSGDPREDSPDLLPRLGNALSPA